MTETIILFAVLCGLIMGLIIGGGTAFRKEKKEEHVCELLHAEWKVDEFPMCNKKFITCSHCESTIDCSKGYIDENEYDYCPYCSAKMDGLLKEGVK